MSPGRGCSIGGSHRWRQAGPGKWHHGHKCGPITATPVSLIDTRYPRHEQACVTNMLTVSTRIHYGLTCLLKDLWTWPWLSLRTTAYCRIQYVLSECMIILATTSTSLPWGMASYALVTSACRIHVSTIKHGWIQGQGSCWLCPWRLGSNLPTANLQELERCRRILLTSPLHYRTFPSHIPDKRPWGIVGL